MAALDVVGRCAPRAEAGTGVPATPVACRLVLAWLWTLVALVFVMVVVGGATRLTGSGLSITEWRPITGALPPLDAATWASEFDKYRASPQYQLLNRGMSLGEFQFIYWWEWGHRQLGRVIGAVMLGGVVAVALTRALPWRSVALLFGLGLVLGLQGVIGWIMVASGLQPGMVAVAPVKLTLHLSFASFFFAGLVWTALSFAGRPLVAAPARVRGGAIGLLLLVFVQIALGGLVAGSKAGLSFNTWPLMDGRLIPPAETLLAVAPAWRNAIENVALIQFNHRIGAYVLLAIALFVAFQARRARASVRVAGTATLVAALTVAQAVLGIVTLLLAVPLLAGLAHQALAFVLLGAAVAHLHACGLSISEPLRVDAKRPVAKASARATGR